MIVRARVESLPSEVPRAARDVVVDAPTYPDAVALVAAELGVDERVMFYRVEGAESRWNPPR